MSNSLGEKQPKQADRAAWRPRIAAALMALAFTAVVWSINNAQTLPGRAAHTGEQESVPAVQSESRVAAAGWLILLGLAVLMLLHRRRPSTVLVVVLSMAAAMWTGFVALHTMSLWL